MFLLLIAIGITCTRAALIITIINPLIPSSFRATVFSIIIMVENLVFALLSPLTGLSLEYMQNYVFLLFGIVMFLSFVLIKGFYKDSHSNNLQEIDEDFAQDGIL